MKEQILNSILNKNNANINDIVEKVIDSSQSAILLYTSYFENLGNKNSDIDIYVFLPDDTKLDNSNLRKYSNCLGVDVIQAGDLELDIEYWTISSIKRIAQKFADSKGVEGSFVDLKILLRIYHGYFINSSKISLDISKFIEDIDILQLLKNRISLEARSLYDEAIKMYEVNEWILALDCARRCIWECASYINAYYGKPNLKSKWISKIFLDNAAFGNEEILQEYLNLQIYSNISEENIEKKILSMFSLIQSMLSVGLFD
ncbi:hypothetical protein D8869_07950 [Streptococcus sanguinis]|uniref:Nucleotidyltransferase domain-containing protein n=1 Tax=Streptococcus sanguinis TaxID=1305 RepID=A0AB74DT71_STRSA|nr:hypothetical protein [Streptococcus sanguinis]RSI12882.1 hypothetical protein D8885_07185 [Streptococcus sanguinis]RSI51783.1 hypothetical protein D8869_07950 [Streptococcus sanguinis]